MMAALATTAMTLGELFGAAAGNLDGVQVEDLVLDSRQITPGAAFLAVQGSESHGLDHVDDALARGAVALPEDVSAFGCRYGVRHDSGIVRKVTLRNSAFL